MSGGAGGPATDGGGGFPVACVLLAARTSDESPAAAGSAADRAARLSSMTTLAVSAGAEPIVAVVDAGVAVPANVRRIVLPPSRPDPDTALRLALARLTNAPVTGVLVWRVTEDDAARNAIFAVTEAARASGAPFVVPIVRGVPAGPIFCARDVWRELVTTVGGLEVVLELYGERVRTVEVDD